MGISRERTIVNTASRTRTLPKGQRAPALVQPICWIADWFGDGKAIRGVA
jgi:hypothetical protein